MARRCTNSKGKYYLDCQVMEPSSFVGRTIQLPLTKPKLTKRQIEDGQAETYRWSVQGLLDTVFHEPETLEDIRLTGTRTTVDKVNQTIMNLWCGAPTSAAMAQPTQDAMGGGSAEPPKVSGPFSDERSNEIWKVLASQMLEGYEQLADVDMLELDPANNNAAMKNQQLRPFWIDSQNKEMEGLERKGCFKKWKRLDLAPNDQVFGSRFHYHIKRDCATGQVTNCKVRLVVMGNRMKEG